MATTSLSLPTYIPKGNARAPFHLFVHVPSLGDVFHQYATSYTVQVLCHVEC